MPLITEVKVVGAGTLFFKGTDVIDRALLRTFFRKLLNHEAAPAVAEEVGVISGVDCLEDCADLGRLIISAVP